ncbi:amino acid ABC transporter permease [Chloroflexota bacterium]
MTQRDITYVETEEPPERRPPVIATGLIGWLRVNLFSNWWNTLLTIVTVLFIAWVTVLLTRWSIQQANWSVVTNNLSIFAVGTYPQEQTWRVAAATLILVFLTGVAWRIYGRASRLLVILALGGVALLFVMPFIAATLPHPLTFFLISGTNTEANPALAYATLADQPATLTLYPVENFADLVPDGYVDRTSATVAGLARQAATVNQRAIDEAVTAGEVSPEDVPPGTFVTYTAEAGFAVLERDFVATVTLYHVPYASEEDAETGEFTFTQEEAVELASFNVGPDMTPTTIEVTFPADGWYMIVPEQAGEIGGFWLQMDGMVPMDSGSSSVTARNETIGSVPIIEGQRVQQIDIVTFPFRGLATFSQFFKMYVGPLAEGLAGLMLGLVLATAAGYLVGAVIRGQPWASRATLIGWIVGSIGIFFLLYGFSGPDGALPVVEMERWGGLLLTLMLTVIGIVAAFPIGVLLALGRRSKLPIVSMFCTINIEFVRGVPLVTILFAASILVPLVDPRLSSVDNVIRAMIGIMFFSAAYLAEIVRGGLQAVPVGQEEAARAVGMSAWQITLLIVLPQALRAVIPAIMGQFVSLFKDTSLVIIIGLLDLLGVARSVINQPEYIGRQREALLFVSLIYFVFSYLMSWASRRLEVTGSGAIRRG